MPAAFAAVLLACYAPYLGVGWRVFGFLGGYGGEEGYVDGGGFFIVALLRHLGVPVPTGVCSAGVVLAILGGVAILVALRPRREPAQAWGALPLPARLSLPLSPLFSSA